MLGHRWKRLTIEIVFFLSLFIVFVPLIGVYWFEHQLRSRAIKEDLSSNWTLSDPNNNVLESSLRLPQDIRRREGQSPRRSWIFEKEVDAERLSRIANPAFVLGRIGDSDRVFLDDCLIGSTGLTHEGGQSGWWWGALRIYPIPRECLHTSTASTRKLRLEVFKWGGPSYGVFGGPIGIGDSDTIVSLGRKIEWLRFNTFNITGFAQLFIGIYYLFVFLLVSSRSHNGIFSLCAISIALFQFATGATLYRESVTGTAVMRVNFLGAVMTFSTFMWFLHSRLTSIPRWTLVAALIGGAIGLVTGLPQPTLDAVYQIYEYWFMLFLITTFVAYAQYLKFIIRNRANHYWRYTVGFTAFIIAGSHDVIATLVGSSNPYVIPYGFFVFSTAVAFALAKEYADAFLHVEEQVSERTRDLASALDRLRGLEKMKERFFANISHDFKTPIAIAMGAIDDVRAKMKDAVGQALEPAEQSLRRLLGMISNLLDTVKAESGALKPTWRRVKIAELLKTWAFLYEALCDRKGLLLEVVTEGCESLEIPADSAKLERVVDNLLSNAVKFSDRRADPSRRTSNAGKIRVSVRTDVARVYIAISDSGIGIPADEREKIFDRYYQSTRTSLKDHGGSGIGLSFAKEMVELHNGSIHAEESEWGGSTFVISLPLSQNVEIVESDDAPTTSAPSPFRGSLDVAYPPRQPLSSRPTAPRILVVEDNPEVAQIVYRALVDDFSIYFAPNGKEALSILDVTSVDAVVSDIMMPVMTGTELVKEIRTRVALKSLPILMLTSRSEAEDVVEHLSLGANDFVQKPFRREVLLARVRSLVENHRLRDRLIAADKMVTLGLLASGIAHEIKNPLLAAQSNLGGIEKVLDKMQEKPERIARAFESASRALGRIGRIVNSMRGYTTGSAERTEIDIAEAVTDALSIMEGKKKEKNVEIVLELVPSLKIHGYPSLHQVFVNIFDNALDAVAPSKGKIAVSSKDMGTNVVISVADNGSGISPEVLPRIFDPFLTTKPADRGTGLGLYITRDIVETQHGGEIRVSSTIGQGTTFTINLPKEAPLPAHPGTVPFHGADLTVV